MTATDEEYDQLLARARRAEARVAELEAEVKKEHDRAEYNAWAAAKNASAKIEQVGRLANKEASR